MRPGRFCACVLLLAARGAPGQQPDSASTDTLARLAPVEVRASILPGAGGSPASGLPARITTLSGSEVTSWRRPVLTDALVALPGFSVFDDLGAARKHNVAYRGFSAGPTVGLPAGLTVFVDGIRQNEPDAQQVHFDLLPLAHAREVEVLSGAGSVLGPNALVGAINLVTHRGDGPRRGTLEVSTGSFGAWGARGAMTRLIPGSWESYASVSHDRERGWRDETRASGFSALASAGRTAARWRLSAQGHATRSYAMTAGSLPESIFRTAPRVNFTAGDFEDLAARQGALSAAVPFAGGTLALSAHARASAAERFNVNQRPDPDVRNATENATLGAGADWRAEHTLRALQLSLRLGADAAAHDVRVRIHVEDAMEPPRLTTHVRSAGHDLAAYAMADLVAGPATLSAGGRLDRVRVPFRDLLDPAQDTVSTFTHLNPRAGLSVSLGAGASVYASIGESFRAPAILELACADPEAACPLPFALGDDPPLAPVRALTREAGARWRVLGVAITATAFDMRVRDEIFFVASEQAVFEGYFTNLPRTRRTGTEISASGAVGGLAWHASHAATRATFGSVAELFSLRADDDFASSALAGANVVQPGDRLPLVPETQLKAGATWSAGGTSLGIEVDRVGPRHLRGDEANELAPLPAAWLAHARASRVMGRWELGAVLTNLFESRAATFGTFNVNRRTGELERFLTPTPARQLRIFTRRSFE